MTLKEKTAESAARFGVDDPASVPVNMKTDVALISLLDVTKPNFHKMRRHHGEAFPKKRSAGWRVHEVLDFIAANCKPSEKRLLREKETAGTASKPGPTYYEWRTLKMKADAERQGIEVRRLNGELVSSADVEREWSRQVANLRASVEKGFHQIAPKLSGLDAPAILVELKKWWVKVQNTMAS